MKRVNLKKVIAGILSAVMLSTVLVGCSSGSTGGSSSGSSSKSKEKTKVTFWYLWGGAEGEALDALIKSYNEKSDKYIVEGLSVPDSQKIMAAISAGNGPDVTDDFNNSIGKNADAGIMEPLDDYIKKTNYDLNDFIPATVESCKMNGKLYALPLNMNFSALYYNKKLLKDAGFNEPPKTMEELYDMAVKTTKVASDGSIQVLGFPAFPKDSSINTLASAAGGSWYAGDGKPSPVDSYGNRKSLQLLVDYEKKFGKDNVIKFSSSGKYLDPTDPFLQGKQVFRIDGPWLGTNIKNVFKSDIDYGVTYIPYPADKPELKGRQGIVSSIFYIPSNAKNKDGAFDFLTYLVGKDGQLGFTLKIGNFPSRLSTLEDEAFKKGVDADFYAELAKSKNLYSDPINPKNSEYGTYEAEQVELCTDLKQDIDTTLNNIYKKGMEIFGSK